MLPNLYGFADFKEKSEFEKVAISIASAEKIRSWSSGEVNNPNTINYRTFKPEKGGLFCARIFGPIKDFECLCGKYKRMKYKGIVCEKCGVEVASSKVRRERMGHIDLATPVVHVWFLKSLPSRIALLLDMQVKEIEKILYFEGDVVVEPGLTSFEEKQILSEEEYLKAQADFGFDNFKALIGGEAIKYMLQNIDLREERDFIRRELSETNSEAKKKKYVKRLKILEDFIGSKNRPESMVLDVLPVIPPDLRPLVPLDGGRFATSDLNDLYRRVINRNNRLKRLMELGAPDIIVNNEKRMLQEAVDALFDNGKRGKVVKDAARRQLKSLSDMLKGKHGRFRQNLLGKRVDYSGRSVIVAGPELRLYQCGLPKEMALELFKPFVYSRLELYGHASTLKIAKKMVENAIPEVWQILEEVIKEHPVLLNRAPTLHRLGIQAFEPILIEGRAIQLHPLVCTAFNADFDGDQMAVHVPLSIESQMEARVLMMSTNNILSPANGKAVIMPSQDIVLGLYYVSLEFENRKGEGSYFDNIADIEFALDAGQLELHSKIKFRILKKGEDNVEHYQTFETTPGRCLVYDIIPNKETFDFSSVNRVLTKKEIGSLVDEVYRKSGAKTTSIFADKIMKLGFREAFRSGISIGKDDMIVPESKKEKLKKTFDKIESFEKQYSEGLITTRERYNKVIDAWSACTDGIAEEMMKYIRGDVKTKQTSEDGQRGVNSIYMMAHSGARGSATQIKQLAGMRGLMAKPNGEIIETPIVSNFKEGLSVLEYFNSAHGARKGLADTALKTANSGYLTRRLVDVAQDCIISEHDCGTKNGVVVTAEFDGDEVAIPLSQKALGRIVAVDTYHPVSGDLIIAEGSIVTEEIAEKLDEAGFDGLKVRSAVMCESKTGICAKCYGRDLATGNLINIGEAVGIIAAQSIGEPGTQLTMRTFHIGGAATSSAEQASIISAFDGSIKIIHKNIVKDSAGKLVILSRNAEIAIFDENGVEREKQKLPYGARINFEDGAKVSKSDVIAEWDPYTIPIITEKTGKIVYRDIVNGVSLKEETDESTGLSYKVIIDIKQNRKSASLRPRITLQDEDGEVVMLANGLEARYFLPIGSILNVEDGQEIHAGDVLARISKEGGRNKDITGGLPRVAELFEARKPKDHAILSEIDGAVEFGKDYRSKVRLIIRPEDEEQEPVEYFIPKGKHLLVNEGDYVTKGELLMDGSPVPHDILRVMGVEALTNYMVEEVQKVYRLQGVGLNDKHIEVIVRQMLQKVEITDSGETTLLEGEVLHKKELEKINQKARKDKYQEASAINVLQGITKAALQTESFISAASFQETVRILTEASVEGKDDELKGLKENVIVGRLIPAGTGKVVELFKKEAKVQKEIIREKKLKEEQERQEAMIDNGFGMPNLGGDFGQDDLMNNIN